MDLRPKLTRRERLKIPNKLRFIKTSRQKARIKKYPQRTFVVLDLSRKVPKVIRKANLRAVLSGKKPDSKYYTTINTSKKLRQRLRKTNKHRKKKQDDRKQDDKKQE